MKKEMLLSGLLALSVMGCDRHESPPKSDNDNTKVNVRDRDAAALTPFDQTESEGDRTITKMIRQFVVNDSNFSSDAKNIKIITVRGVVTLRGPVKNEQEKAMIVQKAQTIAGANNINDQLDIAR